MPPRRRSYEAVVRAVERAFASAGVEHVFVGGLAVLAFGRSRTTDDVDVIAAVGKRDVPMLTAELRRRGFRVSDWDMLAAIGEGGHCTIDDRRSEYRVDLAPAAGPEAKHSLRHRVTVRVSGVPLPVAPPEHTIVMKLKFGSEQDLEDALAIYLRQKARLDLRAMAGFAARVGMSSTLAALRDQVERLEKGPR